MIPNSEQPTTINNDNDTSFHGEDDSIPAIRMSVATNSAGQCKALRHAVLPRNVSMVGSVQ